MLHVRCPSCSTVLQAPEDLAGTTAACASCGEALQVPDPAGVVAAPRPRTMPLPPEPHRSRLRFDEEEDGAPRPGGEDTRPAPGWRFISPSLLVLALLTLPFPWLEVRCSGGSNNPPRLRYTQTGLQVLVGRCTMPETSPDGLSAPGAKSKPAPAPAQAVTTRSVERVNALRGAVAWLWLLSVMAGIGVGVAARTFVPALLSLIFSASAAVLVPTLLVVIIVEEAFNSLTFTHWPLGAFLFCLAATAGSTTALIMLRRAAPRQRHPDPDEDEWPG